MLMKRVFLLSLIVVLNFAAADKKASASKQVAQNSDLSSKHEVIVGSTAADFLIGSATKISFNVGYNYTVMPNFLQMGLLSSLQYASGSSSSVTVSGTLYEIVAGPTLNIPIGQPDIREALFISALAGIATGSISAGASGAGGSASITPTGTINFELIAVVGKRFQLLDNVVFRPNIGLELVSGNVYFKASILSGSVMF